MKKHLFSYSYLLMLVMNFSTMHGNQLSYKLLEQSAAFDYLCPQYCLYQIERIGLQLIDDLDLLVRDPNSLLARAVDEDYILNVSKKLVLYTNRLIDHESKMYHYLPDDIEYLCLLCCQIEEKLMKTMPYVCAKGISQFGQVCHQLATTHQLLDQFLKDNIEHLA